MRWRLKIEEISFWSWISLNAEPAMVHHNGRVLDVRCLPVSPRVYWILTCSYYNFDSKLSLFDTLFSVKKFSSFKIQINWAEWNNFEYDI